MAFATTRLAVDDVTHVKALLWEEHCIECAIPECYSVCPLYVERRDGRCARFVYGIHRHPGFSGLYPFGADIRFRRWGRLEARLPAGTSTPARLRRLNRLDRTGHRALSPLITTLDRIDPKHTLKGNRKLGGAYRLAREATLSRVAERDGMPDAMDEFVVEVTNGDPAPINLIIEVDADRLLFREALRLEPGPNFHTLQAERLLGPFADGSRPTRILVYPENDAESRLIFTWLDFVTYAHRSTRLAAGSGRDDGSKTNETPVPAGKVKVVAWDLDNTLWTGVLIEDGVAGITLRPEVATTIDELDRRGILNVIVSKNDDDEAWPSVEATGMSEYFVARAINWDPKSGNLDALAKQLNINVDTFALVDDSPFERAEVNDGLPQVRTYPEVGVNELLELPEFDVPVTAESRQRRLSYLAEDRRREHAQASGVGYLEFLESCEMQVNVFAPSDDDERARCLELIQRSNQLNLSAYRYSEEEFDALLRDEAAACFAWRCHDRFGDYGIVGFASILMEGMTEPTVKDLVISCRVAKKKVENGLFGWIAEVLRDGGHSTLQAAYRPTARNHVLLDALVDAGFTTAEDQGEAVRTLTLRLDREVPHRGVVTVNATDLTRTLAPARSTDR